MNNIGSALIQPFIFRSYRSWLGLVAQTPVPAPANSANDSSPLGESINQFLIGLGLGNLGPTLLTLVGAVIVLIVGWIIAALVARLIKGLLKRTNVDNRLAQSLISYESTREPNVENAVSAIVFWVIFLVAIVAFLDVLKLTTVSQPLNTFLNQVFAFLPRLGSAAILAGIAWVLATISKTVVIRTARSFDLDQRFTPTDTVTQPVTTAAAPENQFLLSETLGNTLYWFIFLFFLPLILGVLDLQGPLQPVQNLLNEILAALPRILKAILIGAIGWVIARVVRGIVTNLLTATGVDRLGARFGLRSDVGNSQSLSWLIGTVVYVLILIPTAIAALDALEIPAISVPATAMLNQILSAIPQIFTAALIVVMGYVVGRFVADLVSNLLESIGFNNIFQWLGLQTVPTWSPASSPAVRDTRLSDEEATAIAPSKLPITRSPSEIIGFIVLIGILLFATVAATNILNIPALTALVSGLLVIFGQVLVGLVVFAVGLYLANLAFGLITSSGSPQARILGQVARISILALVTAMALQQMGIAASIVNLAFGLLLGAIAVAIALAFGLGGRSIAATQIEEWLSALKQGKSRY
jgi:hypothetical protein